MKKLEGLNQLLEEIIVMLAPLGQDSVLGRFEEREPRRRVRKTEGWGDDESEAGDADLGGGEGFGYGGEEEEDPEKRLVIMVDDRFLNIGGSLSDEYPDADMWTENQEDEAVARMKEVAEEPEFEGKTIELVQGYGYLDKVVDSVVGGEEVESLEEARTIGKKWINKVKELAQKAIDRGVKGAEEITDYVRFELPPEVFDSWEGAESEIVRIIDDTVMTGQRGSDPWYGITHPGK